MQAARRRDGPTRVLIVDQILEFAQAIENALSESSCACEVVSTCSAALAAAEKQPFDLLVAAIESTEMGPLDLLKKVQQLQPAHSLMLLTATHGLGHGESAAAAGDGFRGVSPQHEFVEIENAISATLAERARRSAVRATPSWGATTAASQEMILGSGLATGMLLDSIRRVAAACASVLILGETGSGKELVARTIHAHGLRNHRPLVTVNVASIPEQLLDSEVFGHVRGAFTGASQSRAGLFASADGGTLFLDEIGEMPLGLQAKLLRVLECGELRPVGGDSVRNVDVRIIAATHRNLAKMVEENRFRADLYYRLNVLPVLVPPLRARREDIPELTAHFLERARRRTSGSVVRAISSDAMDVLVRAPWPGNVRELASAVERLVVFVGEEVIRPEHLLLFLGPTITAPPPSPTSPMLTLKQVNSRYVTRVLTFAGGDKRRAAKILGIDLSTLYRWRIDEEATSLKGIPGTVSKLE